MSYDTDFDWGHLETGLPDDFIGTITKPQFTRDPDYNDGATLFLGVELVDPANPGDDPYSARFTVGDGWEEANNGQEVVRLDGKARNFNESTGIGLAIAGLRDGGVDVNALVQTQQAIPTQAAFWNGLTCHWNAVEKTFKNKEGQEVKYRRLVPDSIVNAPGANAGAGAATPAAGATAKTPSTPAPAAGATKKAGSAPAPAAAAAGGIDPAITQRIYDIAMQCDTPDQFMERCVAEIREASTDPLVLAAIEDLEGPNSQWAKAVADYNAANPA